MTQFERLRLLACGLLLTVTMALPARAEGSYEIPAGAHFNPQKLQRIDCSASFRKRNYWSFGGLRMAKCPGTTAPQTRWFFAPVPKRRPPPSKRRSLAIFLSSAPMSAMSGKSCTVFREWK